jgi:capsular polysaccharide biosynthesis protein
LELRRYLTVLRSRRLLILLTVVVATMVGYATTPRDHNYVASATILVGPQQFGAAGTATPSGDVLQGFERITATFSQLIVSRPVAAAAIDKLGLERSADSVAAATSAHTVTNTQLLIVQVSDKDPATAEQLTNAVADAFVAKVGDLRPGQEGGVPFAPVYVFERAQLPTAPQTSGGSRNVIIAGLFGFIAAASLAFLLEYLDITVKTPADVERRLELPLLGVVPRDRMAPTDESRPALRLARESA